MSRPHDDINMVQFVEVDKPIEPEANEYAYNVMDKAKQGMVGFWEIHDAYLAGFEAGKKPRPKVMKIVNESPRER